MFNVLDPYASLEQRLVEVRESILSARRVEWNASQMDHARGVFGAERILNGLYAEEDAICAELNRRNSDGPYDALS